VLLIQSICRASKISRRFRTSKAVRMYRRSVSPSVKTRFFSPTARSRSSSLLFESTQDFELGESISRYAAQRAYRGLEPSLPNSFSILSKNSGSEGHLKLHLGNSQSLGEPRTVPLWAWASISSIKTMPLISCSWKLLSPRSAYLIIVNKCIKVGLTLTKGDPKRAHTLPCL